VILKKSKHYSLAGQRQIGLVSQQFPLLTNESAALAVAVVLQAKTMLMPMRLIQPCSDQLDPLAFESAKPALTHAKYS
jgi:ABC-type methionine transport system ATPase subunit